MLNACLTVAQARANSHAGKGWEALTSKALEVVARKRTRGVVFMAWGKPAGERCKGLGLERMKNVVVLRSVHPSPLSAHKGFMNCGHFKEANEWIEGWYGVNGRVDWNLIGRKGVLEEETKKKVVKSVVEEKKVVADGMAVEAKKVTKKRDEGEETDYDSEGLEWIEADSSKPILTPKAP